MCSNFASLVWCSDVISGMDSEEQLEKIEQYHKDVAVLQQR